MLTKFPLYCPLLAAHTRHPTSLDEIRVHWHKQKDGARSIIEQDMLRCVNVRGSDEPIYSGMMTMCRDDQVESEIDDLPAYRFGTVTAVSGDPARIVATHLQIEFRFEATSGLPSRTITATGSDLLYWAVSRDLTVIDAKLKMDASDTRAGDSDEDEREEEGGAVMKKTKLVGLRENAKPLSSLILRHSPCRRNLEGSSKMTILRPRIVLRLVMNPVLTRSSSRNRMGKRKRKKVVVKNKRMVTVIGVLIQCPHRGAHPPMLPQPLRHGAPLLRHKIPPGGLLFRPNQTTPVVTAVGGLQQMLSPQIAVMDGVDPAPLRVAVDETNPTFGTRDLHLLRCNTAKCRCREVLVGSAANI